MKTKANVRNKIKKAIQKYEIPRGVLAQLAGIWATDVSAWLNSQRDLNPEKVERIAEVVADIEKAVKASAIKPDLRDPQNVARAIEIANAQQTVPPNAMRKLIQQTNDREMQMALPLAEPASPVELATESPEPLQV